MGNSESRQNSGAENGDAQVDGHGVQDYYAILEVDENATGDDIKVCFTKSCILVDFYEWLLYLQYLLRFLGSWSCS